METLTQTTENNKELQKVERVFKSMYKEKIKYIEGTLNNLYDFNNNILNNIKFLNSLIKKLNKDEKILNNKIITREIKELDINKGMILNDISILLETLEYSDEVYIERF